MLQLQFKNNKSKPVWLAKPVYLIGRSLDCGLTISDPQLQEKHAKLLVKGERALITNLVGDAKVRVNGVPVNKPREVTHGDVLCFGTTELLVKDPKQGASADGGTAPEADKPWTLVPMMTALSGKLFEVEGTMTVGRSKECEISLAVTHLSRKHAQLSVTQRGLEIQDLDSANGTYVNGQRVERAILKPGDEVRFDSVNFQVAGPQQDLEATTVRPVLKAAVIRQSAPAAAKKTDTPPPRPHASAQLSAAQVLQEKSSRGHGFGMGLLLFVALAAIAAYLLRNNLMQLFN